MKSSFFRIFEERAFGIFWLVSAQSTAQKELEAVVEKRGQAVKLQLQSITDGK